MRRLSVVLLAVLFSVAACSTGRGGASGVPTGGRAASAAPAGAEVWRTATLRDVLSGQDFRIADLEGKVVAIEAMAIWCVNCRFQQQAAQAALAAVDSPDVVYLSLDIDPNERAEDLAEYARREGFDWRFAVASPDVARSLAASFGDQVLSPPSTPLIVLGPDGQLIEQHLGIKGADDLAALFDEHLP